MSLDGYIAGPKGEYDWIVHDPDIDFGAMFARFDTFLMGRRTFELTLTPGAPKHPGMTTVVFSRTLRQKDHPDVTIVGDDWKGPITALKERPGKDIWLFGGGSLFQSLLDLPCYALLSYSLSIQSQRARLLEPSNGADRILEPNRTSEHTRHQLAPQFLLRHHPPWRRFARWRPHLQKDGFHNFRKHRSTHHVVTPQPPAFLISGRISLATSRPRYFSRS